jgi:hypothetical protein
MSLDKPNFSKSRKIYKPSENTLHYEEFVVPKKQQNSPEAAMSLLLASARRWLQKPRAIQFKSSYMLDVNILFARVWN